MAANSTSRTSKSEAAEKETKGTRQSAGNKTASAGSTQSNDTNPSKAMGDAPTRKPGSQSNSSKQGNNGRGGGK